MSRRKGISRQRAITPDPIYEDDNVACFINCMMKKGKKSLSQRVFYQAMYVINKKSGKDGFRIFKEAMNQVKPPLEVRSRRVGGVTYQVPREVRSERMRALAIRWLILNARGRREHGMAERLAGELLDAAKGQGGAVKKRNDIRRIAESNKAFSHYRW